MAAGVTGGCSLLSRSQSALPVGIVVSCLGRLPAGVHAQIVETTNRRRRHWGTTTTLSRIGATVQMARARNYTGASCDVNFVVIVVHAQLQSPVELRPWDRRIQQYRVGNRILTCPLAASHLCRKYDLLKNRHEYLAGTYSTPKEFRCCPASLFVHQLLPTYSRGWVSCYVKHTPLAYLLASSFQGDSLKNGRLCVELV